MTSLEVVYPVEPFCLPPNAEAWVYIIQAGGRGGPIKIGVATNPDDRLVQLQTGNHLELRALHVVSGSRDDEQRLHRELRIDRIRGEWFKVTPRVVEAIRSLLAEPGRVSWADYRTRPHGPYQHSCRNCGTAAQIDKETRMCGPCREFAELRASGVDPFAEEAA